MADIMEEVLLHQYIYVPWIKGKDTVEAGKELGLYVAGHYRVQPTVVCALKSNATDHDELAKLPIVSERSGSVADGGVVLAWCPTYKVMNKVYRLKKSIVVLVEWPPESFAGWAKLVGAYNVVTDEVMTSGLSEAGTKALADIVFDGYKGWHDDIAARMTTRHLQDLAKSDGYDRDLVLAYARMHRGELGIDRLRKILHEFEESQGAGASSTRTMREW